MAERLLIVLPYVPYPLRRGTYQRVFHLAEQLGQAFEVDLFCLSSEAEDNAQQPVFDKFCQRLHFAPFSHPAWPRLFPDRLLDPLPTTVQHWKNGACLEALRKFAQGQTYAAVHFCDLVLWPYIHAIFPEHPCRILDRSRVDWLFQTEELNTLPLSFKERLLRRENLWKIARLERSCYRAVAQEIVCGWDDKAFLKQHLGQDDKIFVLANGYNEHYFDAAAWPRQLTHTPSAMFCGALDYTPNVDGLRWYFSDIHQQILDACPAFTLHLVGKSPTAEVKTWAGLKGVELVGEVPDVRPFYQKSWLQIVPLRIGGGTRLKIVESLGVRCPVVSTTLGAQGLQLEHEHDLLLADDAGAFARETLRLLNDQPLRQKLEIQGLAKVAKSYTWPILAQGLTEKYRKLMQSSSNGI